MLQNHIALNSTMDINFPRGKNVFVLGHLLRSFIAPEKNINTGRRPFVKAIPNLTSGVTSTFVLRTFAVITESEIFII